MPVTLLLTNLWISHTSGRPKKEEEKEGGKQRSRGQLVVQLVAPVTESNDNEVSQLDQALSVENKKLTKVCENMKDTHARTHARTHVRGQGQVGERQEKKQVRGERENEMCANGPACTHLHSGSNLLMHTAMNV